MIVECGYDSEAIAPKLTVLIRKMKESVLRRENRDIFEDRWKGSWCDAKIEHLKIPRNALMFLSSIFKSLSYFQLIFCVFAICFYYVDRSLLKKMMKWLKPGGILIYEAHTTNQLKAKKSQYQNSDYLLKPGELLELFPSMNLLKYEEPVHLGEFTSSIILQKPNNNSEWKKTIFRHNQIIC